MNTRALPLTLALLLAAAPWRTAPCQWFNDPYNGMVNVCNAPEEQSHMRICSLAGNKFFIAWGDYRTNPTMLFYQILNAQGIPLLSINGVPIINGNWTTAWGTGGTMVADGEGGCIAVFKDYRDGSVDIYGQRFDSLGNRLWGETGLPLAIWPGPTEQDAYPKDVVADSLGNFFLAIAVGCYEFSETYIQKFNINGQIFWGPYGAPVCTGLSPYLHEFQQSVPDMQGGVIDVWLDGRAGGTYDCFYIQHLDANGNPLLPVNGIQLINTFGSPMGDALGDGVSDGQGGGIFNYAVPGYQNIFWLFRVNGQGHVLWNWTNNIVTTHGFRQMLRHPTDGTIWTAVGDSRTGSSVEYLYRHDVQGNCLFPAAGLPFGGLAVVATGEGVITVDLVYQQDRLNARRIDSTGTLLWQSNLALSNFSYSFGALQGVTDANQGMIIAFEDFRQTSISGTDISAQRVLANGQLGNPVPNPRRPDTTYFSLNYTGATVRFTLPQTSEIQLELYDLLGRRVQALLPGVYPSGEHYLILDTEGLPSGVYWLRLTAGEAKKAVKVVVWH